MTLVQFVFSLFIDTFLIDSCTCSMQSAQMAQLASTELFQCLYFSSLGSEEARDRVEGVVVGLRSNGLTVMVPRYMHDFILYQFQTRLLI